MKEDPEPQKTINNIFSRFSNWVAQIFRSDNNNIEESVINLIEESQGDGRTVSNAEREIIHNVMDFGNKESSDIMIPRMDIVAESEDIPLEQLKKVIAKSRHTRIPIYKENLDHITGFVHVKDLVTHTGKSKNLTAKDVARKNLVVPPSMKIIDLLLKMRVSKTHIAIVVDEYGGTDGIITIEDLIEEIVGEIEDEHDTSEKPYFTKISNKEYEIGGRLSIEELNEQLGLTIDDTDFDTVNGLLNSELGYIPVKGEVVKFENLEFEVKEADPRAVRKVILKIC